MPAVAGPDLELRRPAAQRQPGGPGAHRGAGHRAREPGAAARPEQPLAGGLLAGRHQGGRGRGHHDGPAAVRGTGGDLRYRPGGPGALRSPLHRRTGRGGRAGAADRQLRRRRPRRPGPAGRPAAGHVQRGGDRRRRRGDGRVHLGDHRPAQGGDALPPRGAGHRRYLLRARATADSGRHLHRHPAARVHLWPGRAADLPVARRRGDAAAGEGHSGGAGRSHRRPRRHHLLDRADRLPGHARRGPGPRSCAACAARSRPASTCRPRSGRRSTTPPG